MGLAKATKYPALTPEFRGKLERRRLIYLNKYHLVNDLLEKPGQIEAPMVQNVFTTVLYRLFGWLVVKDESK